MKKRWILPLIAAIALTVSACSSNGDKKDAADGNASAPGNKKTVTIAVMSADRFLQTAAQKFEELHPDIHIEINEYMATETNGDGMSAAISQDDIEKYIQTVTTQALSGKGSDLIKMDNLPQDKFAKNGMLVNLYDWMAKDSSFDKTKYYENIFKASQSGDGLYAMPFFFMVNLIEGNTETLNKANITIDDKTWTWDTFRDIAKKLKEKTGPDYVAFVNKSPQQLLSDLIENNYAELVQGGKANFDSDAFRTMMKQIKTLYDEGVLKDEFTYDYTKGLFRETGIYNLEQALTDSLRDHIHYYSAPGGSGETQAGPFKSFFNLGMNSKSKVQQEAWEFVKFMLSDEMQSSPELQFIPMNKGVAESKLKDAADRIVNGSLPVPKGKTDAKSVEERTRMIQELLNGAGKKQTSDFKVVSIAMEEFESYMGGQKSAENVSQLIQNRVTIYLNE
ncbi:ABC transporter substrate-binding protein [Paenibacillus spongiae]|uniref:Extracellular solute-binding protein n=1 Tax=Paenibacillus spongiae TaxID=2909671 RepID=A0ABY5S500_9BACL|nr:extracellular solute-binding protein [Paenibacillus spongiae]UVI27942.1 extracellular solute-binding protein [Paenibacillus spongiae]